MQDSSPIRIHPGNLPAYDFDAITPLEDSPLAGKRICILGSSVAYGSASCGKAVGEYFAARLDAGLTKEAVSGTTLAGGGEETYVHRMMANLSEREPFGLFICQLSTNDAVQKLPLGEISREKSPEHFDTGTVTGALEAIIAYAQKTWRCPVVFFTGTRFESEEYAAMVLRLIELKERWEIGVLDLWSDDAFNDLEEEKRSLYMSDGVHPTKAGYLLWWGPELERQLIEYLRRRKKDECVEDCSYSA